MADRQKNLLLDRDGTLIEDKHYLHDPGGVTLLPGVGDTLALLAMQGWRFFVVSNQSGIGRGYFDHEAVHACNAAMAAQLALYNVTCEAMLYCPHAPEAGCLCRKPGLGMWITLQAQFGLHSEETCMVGDKREDMAFGAVLGARERVLVATGKGASTISALKLEEQAASGGYIASPASSEHPHRIILSFKDLPESLQQAGDW